MIRLFSFISIAFLLCMQTSFSLDIKEYTVANSYAVGKTPLVVFTTSNNDGGEKLNILCYGVDSDYNGEYSEGEELPSWWIIDSPDAEPRKVLEFDKFFSSFTPRVGLDKDNSIMYIPLQSKVVSIDLENEAIDDDDVADIEALAIDFAGGHLLLTVSGGPNQQGNLEVFNLQTSKVLQTIPGGINMSDCIYYPGAGGISIAILNQGEYGSPNGTVYYGSINHMFDFTLSDSVVVGETPNHIMYKDGNIYCTVNGSHCVKVINVSTHEVKTWYTGTIGWDGPRESFIDGDKLFVTTYSGDIRTFDLNTGNLIGVYPMGSDIDFEGLTKWNGYIATASPTGEFYSTNNKVFTWTEHNNDFFSDTKVQVGSSPIGMFYEEMGPLHVICAGIDGSEAPSWWTISRDGNQFLAQKQAEFPSSYEFSYPFKGVLSGNGSQLYIPTPDAVVAYSLANFSLVNDNVAPYTAKALASTYPIGNNDPYGNYLFIATATESGADSVIIWDVANNEYVSSFYAGNNIEYLEHFVGVGDNYRLGIAILRKDPSTLESSISYGSIIEGEYHEMTTEEIGKNAVKIKSLNTGEDIFLGAISLDDNELTVINVGDGELATINLGTQYPNGPADLLAIGDMNFVASTYLGDYRSITVSNNGFSIDYNYEAIIPAGISAETAAFCDMAQLPGQAYFAATNNDRKDGEFPNSSVKILYNSVVSVQDYPTGNISQIKIYPNPSSDYVNVQTDFRNAGSNIVLQIISINGNIVAEYNTSASESLNYTIDTRKAELSSGTYILRIINGGEIKALPFSIVK